jgi:two-component system, chemotaxis family, protein-glutamate methylesterase/glutaminase
MRTVRLINATCPDCRGPLSEVIEDGVREYRCLVEHRYSVEELLHAHSDAEERALWMAILALEEAAVIARDIATSHPAAAARLLEQADEKLRRPRQSAQYLPG